MAEAGSGGKSFGWAWVAMVSAVALHVTDEALNDFLSFYNPMVESLRERWAWFPMPTFPNVEVWLGGLIVGILVGAALSPLAFRNAKGLRYMAYPLSGLMVLNGLGHVAFSAYELRWVPGVYSSPVLLAASAYLFWSLRESR